MQKQQDSWLNHFLTLQSSWVEQVATYLIPAHQKSGLLLQGRCLGKQAVEKIE
jgi:hypothetical protein